MILKNRLTLSRKAQAAMEFLMTYGWVILIVLASIAALAYFGVLDTQRFVTEKCVLYSGVSCRDFKYTPANIEIVVRNEIGFNMDNASLTINGTGCNAMNAENMTTLENGEQKSFNFICAPSSGTFRGVLTFSYLSEETEAVHNKIGEIVLNIP